MKISFAKISNGSWPYLSVSLIFFILFKISYYCLIWILLTLYFFDDFSNNFIQIMWKVMDYLQSFIHNSSNLFVVVTVLILYFHMCFSNLILWTLFALENYFIFKIILRIIVLVWCEYRCTESMMHVQRITFSSQFSPSTRDQTQIIRFLWRGPSCWTLSYLSLFPCFDPFQNSDPGNGLCHNHLSLTPESTAWNKLSIKCLGLYPRGKWNSAACDRHGSITEKIQWTTH